MKLTVENLRAIIKEELEDMQQSMSQSSSKD